jgi:hypothetical protein
VIEVQEKVSATLERQGRRERRRPAKMSASMGGHGLRDASALT